MIAVGLDQLRHINLSSPTQARILDVLARYYPASLSLMRIAEIVWADDINGGPDDAQNCVSVHMHRLRPVLQALGWHIGRNPGGQGIRLWAPGEWTPETKAPGLGFPRFQHYPQVGA